MKARTFSREFKLEVCRHLVNGDKGLAQLSREHSITASLLQRWRTEYRERGDDAFTPRIIQQTQIETLETKIREMEQFIGQQALEIAALKKALRQSQSRSGSV